MRNKHRHWQLSPSFFFEEWKWPRSLAGRPSPEVTLPWTVTILNEGIPIPPYLWNNEMKENVKDIYFYFQTDTTCTWIFSVAIKWYMPSQMPARHAVKNKNAASILLSETSLVSQKTWIPACAVESLHAQGC